MNATDPMSNCAAGRRDEDAEGGAIPDVLKITGGRRLQGRVRVDGSTSAARVLIAAAAALAQPVVLEGVPACASVRADLAALSHSGWSVEGAAPRVTVSLAGAEEFDPVLPATESGINLAPALLQAHGYAVLATPALDTAPDRLYESLQVLKAFGDEVTENEWGYAIAAGQCPRHLQIALPNRSQAATVTAMIRAASSATELTIESPGCSPETRLLWRALRDAGFDGNLTEHQLRIAPGRARCSVEQWRVPGDRFEGTLYACAMAATRGRGSISGVSTAELAAVREQLERAGATIRHDAEVLHIDQVRTPTTSAWDGIRAHAGVDPRDLDPHYVPLLAALGLSVAGHHRLEDPGHPHRIRRLRAAFARLGTEIPETAPGGLRFVGPRNLRAGEAEATDAHDAAAVVIAALAADGTTVLRGAGHLLRSHANLLDNLRALGARIEAGAPLEPGLEEDGSRSPVPTRSASIDGSAR